MRAWELVRSIADKVIVPIVLKSFSDDSYRRSCEASLQPVLDTIADMKEIGIWLEVTTLIVTGENDSDQELRQIADYLARSDTRIPWHISRFHPDHQFLNHAETPSETLAKAREIGREAGLKYIYLGKVLEKGIDTLCEHCHGTVIGRRYMGLNDCRLENGHCHFAESISKRSGCKLTLARVDRWRLHFPFNCKPSRCRSHNDWPGCGKVFKGGDLRARLSSEPAFPPD